jgi:serine/threonine-protein kinase RIO1
VVRRVAGTVSEEAAYDVLRQALVAANITSADRFIDAVWMVVDRQDYAGGAAAFASALNFHNARIAQKWTAAQVINLMRLAEPGVRRASPRIAHGLRGLYDYVDSH